jgi:hypothetical protein
MQVPIKCQVPSLENRSHSHHITSYIIYIIYIIRIRFVGHLDMLSDL